MRIATFSLLLMMFCVACSETYDHRGKTPLVEVEGNFLYREDLQKALPAGLSADDSLLFAERYIRTWAEDVLLYGKAEDNIPGSADIDKLVENYRRTLIMHTYQQALIQQQLSSEISEQELLDYYQRHEALFKVERPLIKGLFIKVPLSAPQLNKVRRRYKQETQEAVEHLEKYSLRSAVNYEYFYDKWVRASEVLDLIPLQVDNAEEYLEKHREVEVKDTAFHYFLHVSDYRGVGTPKPYEAAHKQIKDMLLNTKQVEFMNKVKDDLYQQAVKKNKINIFSTEHKE